MAKVCSVSGCGKRHMARGLCRTHYTRFRRHGDPDVVVKWWESRTPITCSVDGCDKPQKAKGMCRTHYYRVQRSGTTELQKRPDIGCSVDGCQGSHAARGLCAKHYERLRRHGDTSVVKRVDGERPSQSRERQREYMRKYLATPVGRMRRKFQDAKRRAFAGTDTSPDAAALLAIFNEQECYLCGEPFLDDSHKSLDHVIPLALGGTNSLDNLRVAHRLCNTAKGIKLTEQRGVETWN